MALDFGIFGQVPQYSDHGNLMTNNAFGVETQMTYAASGTYTGETGTLANMYNDDTTDYFDLNSAAGAGGTAYLTFDYGKVLTGFYVLASFNGYQGGSNTAVVTFEHSLDNASWTTVSTLNVTVNGSWFYKSYSGQINFRYVRLKNVFGANSAPSYFGFNGLMIRKVNQ